MPSASEGAKSSGMMSVSSCDEFRGVCTSSAQASLNSSGHWCVSKLVQRGSQIYCQDWFFADLIFQGVRGSGHDLVVRPKGYIA